MEQRLRRHLGSDDDRFCREKAGYLFRDERLARRTWTLHDRGERLVQESASSDQVERESQFLFPCNTDRGYVVLDEANQIRRLQQGFGFVADVTRHLRQRSGGMTSAARSVDEPSWLAGDKLTVRTSFDNGGRLRERSHARGIARGIGGECDEPRAIVMGGGFDQSAFPSVVNLVETLRTKSALCGGFLHGLYALIRGQPIA
jgi:hypothetical protein